MDSRDGRIYTAEEREALSKAFVPYIRPMEIEPTARQLSRNPPRVGRNEPCPCGSGKKFKKCCFTS